LRGRTFCSLTIVAILLALAAFVPALSGAPAWTLAAGGVLAVLALATVMALALCRTAALADLTSAEGRRERAGAGAGAPPGTRLWLKDGTSALESPLRASRLRSPRPQPRPRRGGAPAERIRVQRAKPRGEGRDPE
jgi:hypothetical protein